jgi:hypothetical protein
VEIGVENGKQEKRVVAPSESAGSERRKGILCVCI